MQCCNENKHGNPASAMNLVNPKMTDWAALLPTIQTRTGARAVSLQSWVESLGEMDAGNVENRPAYKLLGFYERLSRRNGHDSVPRFETDKASEVSPTFRSLGPIDSSLMQTWIDQWEL